MTENLYLYALTPASGLPSDLGHGIDGKELELVTARGDVAAVVHRHDAGPYEGGDEDARRWVLQHGEVSDRVWEAAGTVLPASFNVIVAGDDEAPAEQRLQQWLNESSTTLRDRLEQLRGRAELRIEIALDPDVVAEDHADVDAMRADMAQRPPGVQRLLEKRVENRSRELADALADELYPEYRRRLAALCEDLADSRKGRPEPGHVGVLAVSVLVRQEDVRAVGLELANIQAEEPAAHIRFLGPWPPYSFAEVPDMEQPNGEASS